ncbi:hypothetical protein JEM65_08515 [Gelidibacter salicanalis]|uniref:Uncharacterized protein n=1 Tax=Gelidibacter salicanalis TaxID=291193 RepID=A0A934KNS3_9FLAO|nr:hypothetical protein [Gelidibacter salicanalis]
MGKDIEKQNEQLKIGVGYDHNYILNGDGLKLAATVKAPKSGIIMEVLTTEPGMQFFSGNFLNEMETRKNGSSYSKNAAFCLESQHFPDSP